MSEEKNLRALYIALTSMAADRYVLRWTFVRKFCKKTNLGDVDLEVAQAGARIGVV